MYNSGNSSKNVTGASVVDGTLENADYADNAISGDKVDGGTISNFTSTGIDDNATSTAITIDASEFVGIGHAAPPNLFTVRSLVANDNVAYIHHDNASQSTSTVLKVKTDAGPSDGYNLIDLHNNTGSIFKVDGLGGASLGKGIKFNGDTAAANALDDYEEGLWTAAYENAGTMTYYGQTGLYTKIGNTVFAECHINVSGVGTASGDLAITGLPYTSANTANLYLHGANQPRFDSTTNDISNTVASVPVNGTKISFQLGSSISPTTPSHANLGTGNLYLLVVYRAA